ncbi:MAG: IS1380 family transposase [Elusimicrobia bacterium]|nr:IS1380 family transposase [Elusimicrobiota bacterium]
MGKGLQKIKFTFGEEGLTYFAGIPIIHQFCKSLQLKWFFHRYLHLSHRNTYYHWADLLLSHFYFTIAGVERLDHLTFLKYNGLLPHLTGLHRLPGTRAMRDFLLGLTPRDLIQIKRVHDLVRYQIFQYPQILTTAIIDFDSAVLTVYGHQEQAERGYNPGKRGRRSYHPIIACESHLKISLNGQLRPGKATNRSEVIPFIKAALKNIPSTIAKSRIRIRADAGFYCWPTIKFLDEEGYGYAIVAQVTDPIKLEILGLRYHIFNHQEQRAIAEFSYKPHGWKQEHRFIVMRQTLPPEPETNQGTLFTVDRYKYHVLVTNLDLRPESVWYFYNIRAAIEINVKELKWDFFLTKIPTRKFLANQAHLQLLLLDYDLFRWFQMLCLPPKFQSKTLKWVRRHLLIVPGKFVTPGNKNILRFPKSFMQQHLFQQIYQNATKVKSLLK